MPQGGARDQNQGHLSFFFAYFSIVWNIPFEQHVPFRVFLSDRKVAFTL